jgi:spore coat polysaccharide biosynthesis protein SpsF
MSKRVAAVIQARMSSSRLPGKVLLPLAGRPILDWVFRAARASQEVDEVVLATSTDRTDDSLATFAEKMGVRCVRGPLDDVLSRFLLAASETSADAVVRLTADCPLLDPALIDSTVSIWRYNDQTDYVATTLTRTLPRGLDVECVRVGALKQADKTAENHHRTHVTSLLYEKGSPFSQFGLSLRPEASAYRLTVDTDLDFAALKALVQITGDRIVPWNELVSLMKENPAIVEINKSVKQKQLVEG